MLQECANNIWFYLHVYLILIISVPIMRYDNNKKNLSHIFKKEQGHKRASRLLLQGKKNVNKGSSILR